MSRQMLEDLGLRAPLATAPLDPTPPSARASPDSTPLARAAPDSAVRALASSGNRRSTRTVELEELRKQLEALRKENSWLKLQTTGEASLDEDEAGWREFLSHLKCVLQMRSAGRFEQATFDQFEQALVALSDQHLRDLYSGLMLIYIDEHDAAVLERLGIGEPDESTVGFAEMVTIRLGELMDVPRHVRIQNFQTAQRRKDEKVRERAEEDRRAREVMATAAAQREINERVGKALQPRWRSLLAGEGEASEVRRFQRHPELRLLVASDTDLKMISPYDWRNMACSSLREQELRCLSSRLDTPGMPAQADGFKRAIAARLATIMRSSDGGGCGHALRGPRWRCQC